MIQTLERFDFVCKITFDFLNLHLMRFLERFDLVVRVFEFPLMRLGDSRQFSFVSLLALLVRNFYVFNHLFRFRNRLNVVVVVVVAIDTTTLR